MKRLIRANELYRNGKSIMSDEDYDNLYTRLSLNPGFKEPVLGETGKCKLPFKLLSLDKLKPNTKLNKFPVLITDKLDGISCLIYNNRAFTRGDGIHGTEITACINNIPIVDPKFAIRGELVVSNKNLEEKYVSARNMVQSYISRFEKSKFIQFIAYELICLDGKDFKPSDQFKYMENLKIKTVYNKLYHETENFDLEKLLETRRCESEFDIDGLVISYENEPRSAVNLNANPKYSKAFKKNLPGTITDVKNIEWNVGKTGVVVPTIVLNPVKIDNNNISRVSGNNYNFLISNGIGVGSIVHVIRSGQSIPYISEVIKKSNKINIPDFDFYHLGPNIFIENKNDVRILSKKLEYFFKTLKIKNVGIKTCEELCANNYTPEIIIKTGLNPKDIKRNSEKIINSINFELKNTTPVILLAALSYYGDGKSIKSIEKLKKTNNFDEIEIIKIWKKMWL